MLAELLHVVSERMTCINLHDYVDAHNVFCLYDFRQLKVTLQSPAVISS